MPSTYTDLLRLEDQATGENPTTWGDKADANWNMLEDAIAGMATISTTGGTYTLSTNNAAVDEARMAVLKITGVLVSNSTIVVPAGTKVYLVHNATTGNFSVTVKVTGLTGVVVPQGSAGTVYCNGTDVVAGQTLSFLAAAGTAQVNTFTKTQSVTPVALTSAGASIAWNVGDSNLFTHTTSQDTTLAAPTGSLVAGTTYIFKITQGATARLLSYNAATFKFPGGTVPTLTATIGAKDILSCVCLDGTTLDCVLSKDHK